MIIAELLEPVPLIAAVPPLADFFVVTVITLVFFVITLIWIIVIAVELAIIVISFTLVAGDVTKAEYATVVAIIVAVA